MRKVAFITGASRLKGIGASTALLFAKNNYDIVITGTKRDKKLIRILLFKNSNCF